MTATTRPAVAGVKTMWSAGVDAGSGTAISSVPSGRSLTPTLDNAIREHPPPVLQTLPGSGEGFVSTVSSECQIVRSFVRVFAIV